MNIILTRVSQNTERTLGQLVVGDQVFATVERPLWRAIQREGQSLLNSPPPLKPGEQRRLSKTDLISPLTGWLTNAAERQDNVAVAVVGLSLGCSPSAIAGFVIAVCINSIKRHARRAFAHVSKEILERIPSFANGDAAPTVDSPASVFLSVASRPHSIPRLIDARVSHPVTLRGMLKFRDVTLQKTWMPPRILRANRLAAATLTKFDSIDGSHFHPLNQADVVRSPFGVSALFGLRHFSRSLQ